MAETEHILVVERQKTFVIRVDAESAEAALAMMQAEPTSLYEAIGDGEEVEDHLQVRLPDGFDRQSWWWAEETEHNEGSDHVG